MRRVIILISMLFIAACVVDLTTDKGHLVVVTSDFVRSCKDGEETCTNEGQEGQASIFEDGSQGSQDKLQ